MKPTILTTKKTCYASATYMMFCSLGVDTSSTEPCGGDAGHGARSSLTMKNHSSTCWTVEVTDEDGTKHVFDCPVEVTLRVAGDCEQSALLAALEQMVATMREAGVEPHEVLEGTRTDPFAALRALREKAGLPS